MIKEAFESARTGDGARLTEILQADPAIVHAENSDGLTLLGFAAHFGQAEIVGILLEFGVDMNKLSHSKVSYIPSNTALHAAIAGERNWDVITRLLGHNADPNVFDSNGHTALHVAAFHADDVQLIDLLIEHGADVNAHVDSGENALSLAIAQGNERAAERLRAQGALA